MKQSIAKLSVAALTAATASLPFAATVRAAPAADSGMHASKCGARRSAKCGGKRAAKCGANSAMGGSAKSMGMGGGMCGGKK